MRIGEYQRDPLMYRSQPFSNNPISNEILVAVRSKAQREFKLSIYRCTQLHENRINIGWFIMAKKVNYKSLIGRMKTFNVV